MSLTGKNVEEQMWNFFMARVGNAYGVSALMGHWFAESGLNPRNLQNSFEKKLGYTDESYTEAVDSGSYTNFVNDSAGYGLAQWTYWSRKQSLLSFAQGRGCSIGDTEMQFEFGYQELCTGYKSVLAVMKSAKSVREASDVLLTQYERPADQSEAVKVKRAGYGEEFYKKYAGATIAQNGGNIMSNSSLVTYTNITKTQKTSPRTHAIDTITIHCVVGQWTAKQICDYFANADRNASCNYGVGKDGSIGLCVDEADRSWCSSNAANDHRAVTIEVASDTKDPYAVTDEAYQALIKLVADICKRNGISKLVWSTEKADRVNHKNGCNMTVHRDFAAKACPGEYLYSRHADIAAKVNALLGVSTGASATTANTSDTVTSFPATPFTVQVVISDLCIRKTPAMGDNKTGKYTGKGTFTITEVQNGWGKLKSGAGWIWLENPAYCTVNGSVVQATTTATTTAAAKKSVEEIAKEVIQGKWGNGADRKKKLEAAGYNYAQVQAAVNRQTK